MSTTVTYKGNTLTTVDNQTRTLKTAGKYLEDDITLVDSTSIYTDVVEILPNGGEHHIITTDISLANDTVTANTLLEGTTAHDASGNAITGTFSGNDFLKCSLRVTNNFSDKGFTITALRWNNNRFTNAGYLVNSNSASGDTIIPILLGYNLMYIGGDTEIDFTNLNYVDVANNGERVPFTSTQSYYVLRVRGVNTREATLTLSPKTT